VVDMNPLDEYIRFICAICNWANYWVMSGRRRRRNGSKIKIIHINEEPFLVFYFE